MARHRKRMLALGWMLAVLLLVAGVWRTMGERVGLGGANWRVLAVGIGHLRTEGTDGPAQWVFAVVRRGRVILVDTGFDDLSRARQYKMRGFRRSHVALFDAGYDSASVTDVVLTRLRWDHAGNVLPWERSRIWLHRAEWEWARAQVSPQQMEHQGVRLIDVARIEKVQAEGRLVLFDESTEIAPGVVVHPPLVGSLSWVEVRRAGSGGAVVLAGCPGARDSAVDERPTVDQGSAATADSPDLIVTGHDRALSSRFETVRDQVVLIE